MLVECLPLPAFDDTSLTAVRDAFGAAMRMPLGQAWRAGTEPEFAPATVRTGWRGDTLWVFATLTDADIFTRADRHNDKFWELGDTFEMFLQPQGGPGYAELHVTPNNLRLHLRFAGAPAPASGDGADAFAAAVVPGDLFRSRTWVNAGEREWCVLATVPAGSIGPPAGDAPGASTSLAGSVWRVSFCRYDYTRGRAQPVISSTSPHTEPRFHRPHEWSVLRFAD